MTKQEQIYYYQKWAFTKENITLRRAYKNPSPAKRKVWDLIKEEMAELNGFNLSILTFNTFMFTCAYEFSKDGMPYLVIHTPTQKAVIDIIEIVHELENRKSRTDEP